MHQLAGWTSSKAQSDMPNLEGWQGNVWVYYKVPHRILVIGLRPPNEAHITHTAPYFLVCVDCKRINVLASWKIGEVHCSFKDDDNLVIADSSVDVRIDCVSARIFDKDSIKKWFSNNRIFEQVTDDGHEPQFFWGFDD